MEQRELDVTILSANNLKNVKLSGRKMSPYAVAYVYPNVKVSTTVAKQGGENPSWNCILHLSCDERLFQAANAHVTVEIYNHGKFSNKLIGTALVPLSAGKDPSEGKSKEYKVMRPSNKAQGTLNVSVMAGKVVTLTPSAPPPTPQPVSEDKAERTMPGYPAGYINQASGSQPQFPSQLHQQPYIPPPGYQPQFAQQAYYQQQAYQRPQRSRFGGGGLGAGLLGGALGGLVLGSALDGGFGDGGGGFGDGGGGFGDGGFGDGGGGFGDGGGGFGDGGGDFGGGGDF